MTRNAQCYVRRDLWLAVRLAAKDASLEPEEIVDSAIADFLATHHPTATKRAEAYLADKQAAWKKAEKPLPEEP